MSDLQKQLIETMDKTGLCYMSLEKCCKLLVWIYWFGGSNETVVYNTRMRTDIEYASNKTGVKSGSKPNKESLKKMKILNKEIESWFSNKNKAPNWVYEICDKYGISKKYIDNYKSNT